MLIGRTVLAEAGRNFFASLLVTTSMAFFLLSITFLKRTPGVGLGFLLEIFPLFFPLALQFTVPLAVLSSVVLTFGRMAGDGELMALSSCGVAPGSVVRPVLAGAAVVAAAALLLTDMLAPFAASQLNAAKRDLPQQLQTSFRAGLSDLDLGRGRISFESFSAGTFRDVCLEYRRTDEEVHLWRAEAGSVVVTEDDRVVIRLENAQTVMPYGSEQGSVPISAGDVALEASLADIVGEDVGSRRRQDLTAWQLAYVGGRGMGRGPGVRIPGASAAEELARRSALAASAFFFALIGVPLGVLSARGGRVGAFLVAVAPVLLLYFPVVIAASNLARRGDLPAYPSLWAGNLLLGVLGLLLLRLVVRT